MLLEDTNTVRAVDDFNADIREENIEMFGVELMNFCKDKGLVIGESDVIYLGSTKSHIPYNPLEKHPVRVQGLWGACIMYQNATQSLKCA